MNNPIFWLRLSYWWGLIQDAIGNRYKHRTPDLTQREVGMNKRIAWVRLAYWAGIVADIVAALFMLFPSWDSRLFEAEIVSNPIFELGVRRGAALMIGWTVLLIWADRKPIERRAVLLITICPAMLGSLGYLGYALLGGFTSLKLVVPSLITEIVFLALFIVGYLNAQKLSGRSGEPS